MADIEIKDSKGKASGKHSLAAPLADLTVDSAVLHRAVVSEEANKRQGTHSAKTRSEARGGGRKPYKQKKTGNARQGTIRAPHYAHGGMALAIKPRDYSKKMNKKERRLATIAAFAERVRSGDIQLVKDLTLKAPKTKDAVAILNSLGLGETKRVLVVTAEHDMNLVKSLRNVPGVVVRTAPSRDGKAESFSTRDLLVAHKIVMTADAMKKTEDAFLAKKEAKS
ncbi:MAG: 50S ribosomal protein L4 [Fimbriimonadaceae bacterium]|nr:50S ribosomal protein L4 [Armatimonadota bacterium]